MNLFRALAAAATGALVIGALACFVAADLGAGIDYAKYGIFALLQAIPVLFLALPDR